MMSWSPSFLIVFVVIVLLINEILCPHFDGGTISWIPINKNDTTVLIQVLITQTYMYTISRINSNYGMCIVGSLLNYTFQLDCTASCNTSGSYRAIPSCTYVTGSSLALDICYTQRSDVVNLTDINAHFSVTYGTSPNSRYTYRVLNTGVSSVTNSSNWNITAVIDIRRRPDGFINTPPTSSLMSPTGVPYNVPTVITIPTSDIDGDNVRCRWSNGSLECGDACFPANIPASTTLSSNCKLNITGTTRSGWYCAAIQKEGARSTDLPKVEDFWNSSTSTPFSSVPIQVLIYAYNASNCSAPDVTSSYTNLNVLVNSICITTLYAHNYCGSSVDITDISIQAFPGIVTSNLTLVNATNNSLYSKTITYMPSSNQVGLQLLCASAIDSDNIPSAQYCTTFVVSFAETTGGFLCSEVSTVQTIFATSAVPTSTARITSIVTTSAATTMVSATSKDQTTNNEVISSELPTSTARVTIPGVTTGMESTNETTTPTVQTSIISLTSMTISSTSTSVTNVSSTSFTLVSITTSKPNSVINWPLVVGIALGLLALLALTACCCYYWLWHAGWRHRRQNNDEHRPKYMHHPSSREEEYKPIQKSSKPYVVHSTMEETTSGSSAIRTSMELSNEEKSPLKYPRVNVVRLSRVERSSAVSKTACVTQSDPSLPPQNARPLRVNVTQFNSNTGPTQENDYQVSGLSLVPVFHLPRQSGDNDHQKPDLSKKNSVNVARPTRRSRISVSLHEKKQTNLIRRQSTATKPKMSFRSSVTVTCIPRGSTMARVSKSDN